LKGGALAQSEHLPEWHSLIERRKIMKSKVFISLLLAVVMLVALAIPVFAGAPTEKIKYSHRSDCMVTETSTLWHSEGYVYVGDSPGNTDHRALFKFPLGGIKVSNIDWVELQFHIYACNVNGTYFPPDATFPNIGLGDTLVVPIEDYGRTPSTASYNSTAFGPSVVMIDGTTASVPQLVSANVTAAVIAAKDARERFVTFRVQTAVGTDNDGVADNWFFSTKDASTKSARPILKVHLKS
jgi:hypothetical protein